MKENNIAWKFVCLLRYQEYHFNCGHKIRYLLYKYLRTKLSRKYNLYVPMNIIDKGFLMFHPFNIVINAKKIGKNLSIQFNCSIAAGGHGNDIPTLGDDITIGVGATLLGDIVLANGIAIGANSLVNKTCETGDVCLAGSPAKIVSQNGSKTWGGSVQNVLNPANQK